MIGNEELMKELHRRSEAYPELVAALRGMITAVEFVGVQADQYERLGKARALLAKLGEQS